MNLLVTGAWKCTEEQLDSIKALGHNVVFMQDESGDLPCQSQMIEGVICNGLFLHHDITEFTSLRYIQLTSAGLDRVPLDYVNEHKIKIFNARGVYSIPMAEFAISGVLQLYKQSKFFYEKQSNHKWEKRRDLLELNGKIVLIVGCGSVGAECAKRFSAFGCRVYGIDIKPYENAMFLEIGGLNDIDAFLNEADIVVLTLPLTKETRGLFGKERFDKMKNDAILVNIARGAIVEEKALLNALKNKLFGAVFDVFEEEPLNKNNELWKMENFVLTPHVSFIGNGNGERLFEIIKKNISECV